MTDVSTAEMPTEPALHIPPVPAAAAELEAPSPEAPDDDGLAPATDQGVAAPIELPPALDDAPSEVARADAPALPFDVEHLGPLRRAVLDHLVDTDEPQSVAQILAAMPVGTTRGSGESAIKREFDAGRIERVAAGTYVLAKPKSPKPAEPTRPSPVAPEDEQVWLAAFEAWVVRPDSWDREKLGPRPNEPGRRIPADIVTRGVDRSRKRKERRKEREAAQARQAAADQELRDRLIAAAGNNVVRSSALDNVAPIRAAMELVPLDRILSSIRNKTDRKLYPKNEPARSWGEERLLREIAESYTRTDIVPNLIAAWSTAAAAGKAPADPSRASREGSPPAVEMPDDTDELRSRHDDEHAPAGPHSLVHPDAALGVSQEAAGAPDPSPAVQVPPEPGDASTVPPENGSAPPDDSVAEPGPEPVSELPDGAPSDVAAAALVVPAPPVPDGRAAVLAAFNRNRTPPSPQPAAPQPSRPAPPQARPAERPWFAAQKVPQQESEMTDDGWRFVLEGYVVGSVAWATKHGPPPGSEGCRVPRRVLKEFKF